ncbi:hypothetical protein HKX48_005627 [Thoreauomyces humboldtii]|nr:hypothetical protein HKX48_005627 [Thoreauomyces humboldtii]
MSSVISNMMATASLGGNSISPPVANKILHTHKYLNVETPDNYHWMKDMNKEKRPEIISYLTEENKYTQALHLDHNAKLIETIYDEFVSRVQEDDADPPVYKAPFHYYKRTEKGKQYPIYARKKGDMSAPEEVLLDQNQLDFEFQSLGLYKVSPDHSILAYSLDTVGDEIHTIYFKNLATGKLLEGDSLKGEEIEWTNDQRAVYYTILDDIHRQHKVFKHVLGTDPASDQLIFHEEDEKFMVSIHKSVSQQYIFISSASSLTTEMSLLDAATGEGNLRVFSPRKFRHQYQVEHQENRFLVLTDGSGEFLNFKLCSCPLDATSADNWEDILPYDPLVHLTGLHAFKTHVALYSRTNALEQIQIIKSSELGKAITKGSSSYTLEFDEPLYTVAAAGSSSQSYDGSILRFSYSSPLTPPRVLEHDTASNTHKILKQTNVPNYDPSKYVMKLIYAPLPKGTENATAPGNTPIPTQVPIQVIHRKDLVLDGKNPCLLYGYGSYGISIDPDFQQRVFSYVDRGYVYATANIRGGGECGRAWHWTGKFLQKKNTFEDFAAAAKALVEQKFTSPDRTAIEGRSAGGLLIGAVLNRNPEIAAVAIAGVPFVDVINTMMDDKIPLTINEYEEWGNPNEREYFDYMSEYSPYDNLAPSKHFPDVLVKAGLNDPRVQYWEPAKWVAKARVVHADHAKQGKIIVFDCKMGSGHFGHSGRYAYLKEAAADYAFVIDRVAKSIEKSKS